MKKSILIVVSSILIGVSSYTVINTAGGVSTSGSVVSPAPAVSATPETDTPSIKPIKTSHSTETSHPAKTSHSAKISKKVETSHPARISKKVKISHPARISKKAKISHSAKISKKTVTKKATKLNIAKSLIKMSKNKRLNKSLVAYVNKVPRKVLKSIKSLDYTIELKSDVGKKYKMRNICGLTLLDEKRILIQSKRYKFRKTVVHEIAHAYDDYLGRVSHSDKFQQIYNNEVDKFKVHDYISTHYKDNVDEYFAEAFQEYIYHREQLKRNVPQTYKYIKSCL